MRLDRKTFDEQRGLRFGRTNPERMRLAFWEAMVHDGSDPYRLRERFQGESLAYPTWAWVRAVFQKLTRRGCCRIYDGGPIWCFDRMGQTRTELADGRTVCVGGEHEDHYDPDFAIYNDVVILGPDDQVEIYGYPKEVFPPTDFHSASLVDQRILVIGSLGYPADRVFGTTLVWSIDLASYRIDPVATLGESPGWIFKHEAEVDLSGRSITVRGGEVVVDNSAQGIRRNLEEYRLHLADGRWERITDRRTWRQFAFYRAGGGLLIELPERITVENLPKLWFDDHVFQPPGVPHEPLAIEDPQEFGLVVDEVTIRVYVDPFQARLIVEGTLPRQTVDQVVEEIRANIEAAIGGSCQVVEH